MGKKKNIYINKKNVSFKDLKDFEKKGWVCKELVPQRRRREVEQEN